MIRITKYASKPISNMCIWHLKSCISWGSKNHISSVDQQKAGRSHVEVLTRSLNFFFVIYLILPAALWPCGLL
jgi:hypothetical protein